MNSEIKINLNAIRKSENELGNLSKKLLNRKLKLSITDSKGAVVDELSNAALQLNEISEELGQWAGEIQKAVLNARLLFERTDREIAESLKEVEGANEK